MIVRPDAKQLTEWCRVLELATPGPWKIMGNALKKGNATIARFFMPECGHDVAFAAMAREAVPRLIREVRTLHRERDVMSFALAEQHEGTEVLIADFMRQIEEARRGR